MVLVIISCSSFIIAVLNNNWELSIKEICCYWSPWWLYARSHH